MNIPIRAACPACDHEVDDATGVGDTEALARPVPGDIALCIRCAEPAAYTLNPDGITLGLRDLTDEEKVQLSEREDVAEIQERIRATSGKWLS
jgi:hypothetical protein